jgi:hypothetical protein
MRIFRHQLSNRLLGSGGFTRMAKTPQRTGDSGDGAKTTDVDTMMKKDEQRNGA